MHVVLYDVDTRSMRARNMAKSVPRQAAEAASPVDQELQRNKRFSTLQKRNTG
jgi:hypothetical protein